MSSLFLAHLFATFFLTGLIWVIQLVHYPSFHYIAFDRDQFSKFHTFHSRQISLIVVPMMALELFTAICLFYLEPSTLWVLNLLSILMIWKTTFLVSVPLHNKLSQPSLSDDDLKKHISKLVASNWARTTIWTARSLILIYLAGEFFF